MRKDPGISRLKWVSSVRDVARQIKDLKGYEKVFVVLTNSLSGHYLYDWTLWEKEIGLSATLLLASLERSADRLGRRTRRRFHLRFLPREESRGSLGHYLFWMWGKWGLPH